MRAISLIAPALLAETRYVEVDPQQIARSIRVSDEEILDDLLYPADHNTVRRAATNHLSADPRARS